MIKRQEMITFKIVPDRTVSNRKTHDFMRAVHDINDSWRSRISWKEKKIQEQSRLFWDIIMEKDEVSFFCTVPKSKASFIKQQLELLWEKAAVQEEEIHIKAPAADQVEICEMIMTKHNIFSLKVDRRQETEPLGSLLIGTKEMKEDDFARIQIMVEPVSRISWQDQAEKKHKDFSGGKVPKRLRISKKDALLGVGDGICYVMDHVSEALDTVMDVAAGKASERDKELRDQLLVSTEQRLMLMDGGLSKATSQKKAAPTFKTWIRIQAASKDPGRKRSLISTLSNGFSDLNGDNELERSELHKKTQARILEEMWSFAPSLITLKDPDAMVLSCLELGRLVEMPTAALQDSFEFESIGRREVQIPKALESGIPWGKVTIKGETKTVHLPTNNWGLLCRPHLGLGKMFTGKSTLGARMGALFPAAGFTSIVLDTADGKLIDDARDALPADFPDSHIIDLDFGNLLQLPSSDWNEITSSLKTEGVEWAEAEVNRRQAANRLSSILVDFLDKLATNETTDRMERYLSAAAKAVLGSPKRGILEVIHCLTSDEYREKVLTKFKITDPIVKGVLQELHDMSPDARGSIVRPIMTRLNVLLSSDYIRNSILQDPKCGEDGKPLINVRRWIDGDPVGNPKYNGAFFVGIRIPKSQLFEDGIDRLATFWDAKVWMAALSRYDLPIKNGCHGRPFIYVRDEPHQTPSAFNIHKDSCREARKWGMKMLWLAHKLEDFDHMRKTLKDAGVQYSMYSTSKETVRSLTEELHPFTQEELLRIPQQHHAVNSFAQTDQAFLCEMFDVVQVKDRSYIRKQCSEKYGRPLQEVEHEIFTKTQEMVSSGKKKKK
jgi:hypothetical protein